MSIYIYLLWSHLCEYKYIEKKTGRMECRVGAGLEVEGGELDTFL